MVLRKAAMRDIPQLLELINQYAGQGVMLPRSEFELAESVRDFTVAEMENRLAGCGSVHFYTPTAGELRSLAVRPEFQGKGVGRGIVQRLEEEAQEYGLTSLFAFTYVPDFFARLGYAQVDRGALPQKAWKDCLRCPKFQNCDEIAVHKVINATPKVGGHSTF